MSKEDDGGAQNPCKSFGATMLARRFGMPVWVWTLDLIVLIVFTKWIGVIVTIQVACLLAAFIYKKLGEGKTKRPVVARVLLAMILMVIPGFFLSAMLTVFYQSAVETEEERAERNRVEFLGVEIGSSIDSERYKCYPRQYVNKGDERYYIIRVPLGRKLFPLEGFDVVNVYASVISHTIYKVELIYEEAVYTGFDEYQKALKQMMESKFWVQPKDSGERYMSFRLKGGTVNFRTGGRPYYSNGKVQEVGPYSTTLSYYKDDLANLAEKEEKEVLAHEEKERAKKETERINRAVKAGVDLL